MMKTIYKNTTIPRFAVAVCISIGVLVSANAAVAATGIAWPPKFSDFDKNTDGVIDPREFISLQNERATKMARPKSVTPDAANSAQDVSKLRFLDFDTNNDSLISKSEYKAGILSSRQARPMNKKIQARSMPGFEDFDTNNDGKLEKDEFYKARNERIKSRAEQGMPMRRLSEAPSFEDIDINKDGVVDKNEFLQHRKDRWRGGPQTQ